MTADPPNLRALESAWEQMPVLLAALEGPEGRIVSANQATRNFLGALPSMGASIADMDELNGSTLDERRREVYETGVPFHARGWRFQIPDAGGVLREHVMDYSYVPWRRADGTTRGVLTYSVDVTEAARAEEAAKAESARWRERFASSQAAMAELQGALLPATVPVLPGLQVAARYLLSEAETSAGGDWFDAVPLPDGRVALVIGDVVGHGIAASATMGQLRAILTDRLAGGEPVTAVMAALDRAAGRIPGATATTVCVAVLDRVSGAVEYCTAGHPPPLVAGDTWRYLPTTGAGPLGSGAGFATATAELDPAELLLLYTDGLVERPVRTTGRSTVEIGEVVTNALIGRPLLAGASTHAADRVCEQSVELLTRITGYTDDITVLAARRIAAPPPLTLGVAAADPAAVASLAVELERWLAAVDAGPGDQAALRHAVVELVSNSVEHAYRDHPPGSLALTATLGDDGHVTLTVADEGQWRDPEQATGAAGGTGLRGFGLALVGQLVDRLTVDHTDYGTTARLRRRLRRPAPLLSTPGPGAGVTGAAWSAAEPLTITEAGEHRLAVVGPLHLATVDALRTRLAIDTRGGTGSLTLDLSGLTVLASTGVQLLQEARADAAAHDSELTLAAAAGSVAHHVLTLVATDHDTTPGDPARTVPWT